METNWCDCKGHRTRDFCKQSNHYSHHFIPDGWQLEYGTFDGSGRDRLHIGAIQTADTDRDTCLMMGGLTGALLYYAKTYLDANIRRYTPNAELAADIQNGEKEL